MIALLLAALAAAPAICELPTGPEHARAALADGRVASITPGALTVGARRFTRCDALPGAHPLALAAWDGGLALGFREAGLWRWTDADGFTRIEGAPAGPIRALATTADGRLWIGSATSGLWSTAGDRVARFEHRVLGRRGITALAAVGEALHVGVDPAGWWRIDARGRAHRRSREPVGCFQRTRRGLASRPPGPGCQRGGEGADTPHHVSALAVHRGELVAGSFDDGLFARDAGGWRRLPGGPRFVNALLAVDGALHVGAADGLYRRGADGVLERVALGLPSEHVNALAHDGEGTLWVATSAGLAAWDGRRVRVLDTGDGLPSRLVYAVAVTGDGAVWAGTAAGAVRFARGGVTRFSQSSGALAHDWVTALLADGDDVLAGTYDAGVARLRPDGRGARLPAFGDAWINPGGLARDGDRLIASTLGGGIQVRGPSGPVDTPRLPSDDVTAIARWRGALWVGTRGGLARLPNP